jgi:hypothetical protein
MFYEQFGLTWTPERPYGTPPDPATLATCSIIVWDAHFSDRLGLRRTELQRAADWQTMAVFGEPETEVILFRKTGAEC